MQQIPAEETSYQSDNIQVRLSRWLASLLNGFQLIDRQWIESIIHDELQAGSPAAPVGRFPRKVPVIGRSG